MDYTTIIIEVSKFVLGGVAGTAFTIWYKRLKDKKWMQRNLFVRLIVAKGYVQIPQMMIDDLNTVEIIFRGNKKVIETFRAYYAELCVPKEQASYPRQQALYWDLMREIGNVVGYKNMDNKTLNSRYVPNASYDNFQNSQEFQKELLCYLKNGNELYAILIENAKRPPIPPTDPTQ